MNSFRRPCSLRFKTIKDKSLHRLYSGALRRNIFGFKRLYRFDEQVIM